MASRVSICNLALSAIGKTSINAIDEASAEARACNQFFDHCRSTLLASGYPWRFAFKSAALAVKTNDRAERWAYAYQKPNDCLRVRRLTNSLYVTAYPYSGDVVAGGLEYEFLGSTIYANVETAYLEYTTDITDSSALPPLFVEALAMLLASKIAMPLTRDSGIRNEMLQIADFARRKAEAADANDQRAVSDFQSEFYDARQ